MAGGEQWVGLAPCQVHVLVVRAHAEHVGIEVLELGVRLAEGTDLGRQTKVKSFGQVNSTNQRPR